MSKIDYKEIDQHDAFSRMGKFRALGSKRFLEAYHDADQYPTIQDVMGALDLGHTTFFAALRAIKKHFPSAITVRNAGGIKDTKFKPPEAVPTKRWIITSIQNNVKRFEPFWKSLEGWAQAHNAEILVIPVHYDWKKSDPMGETKWFDENVVRFRADIKADPETQRLELTDSLGINCTRITATKVAPLSGMSPLCMGRNTVFGHGSVALEYISVPLDQDRSWMATTGSCNLPATSYTPTVAGSKAQFHHTLGALIVEDVGTSEPFYRQVLADDSGGFFDIAGGVQRYYGPRSIKENVDRPLALITGDEHWMWMNAETYTATYGERGVSRTLRPAQLVRHDAYDHGSESHHNTVTDQYRRLKRGDSSIESELDYTLQAIIETTEEDQTTIMVASNHQEHLDKWLDGKGPQHLENLAIFHELRAAQLKAIDDDQELTALELYAQLRGFDLSRIKFLSAREPTHMIGDNNVGMHGDKGMKGARGTIGTFAKASNKFIIGHGHGPGIKQGTFQTGACERNLDYMTGLTNTDTVHGLIYPNGKRTLLPVRGGRWHG